MADDNRLAGIPNISALGDRLREAREGKKITIAQANRQTRIHHAVLKALEDGNCENILDPTYVKSFLKKYAEYLGMDPVLVLNEYKRLRPVQSYDSKVRPSSASHFIRTAAIVTAAIIVAAAVVAMALVLGKAARNFKAPASPKPAAAAKTKRSATRQSSGGVVSIPKNVPLKLLLKVNRPVRVKMRTDGTLLFERSLPKGTAEVFTAGKAINMYVADGSAVELVLNGINLGSPGRGVLKNVEITRSGIRLK